MVGVQQACTHAFVDTPDGTPHSAIPCSAMPPRASAYKPRNIFNPRLPFAMLANDPLPFGPSWLRLSPSPLRGCVMGGSWFNLVWGRVCPPLPHSAAYHNAHNVNDYPGVRCDTQVCCEIEFFVLIMPTSCCPPAAHRIRTRARPDSQNRTGLHNTPRNVGMRLTPLYPNSEKIGV